MKTKALFFLFVLFQLTIFSQTAAESANAPKFKFDTEVIDYGTIPYQGSGDRTFKFTNTGKEPLIISNVQSSCGCLVPSWPREPVKPGASSYIKVHYDTGRIGRFEKTLTVTSNADRTPLVLRIKGEVMHPAAKDSLLLFPAEKR